VLNWVPFRSASRVVTDRNLQSVRLAEIMPKVILPCHIGRVVAAPIVGKNEKATRMRIESRAILFPPITNRVDREGGGIMAEPKVHSAPVDDRIIDAIRNDLG